MAQIKLTSAQINPIVGDIAGNAAKILAVAKEHRDTDLIVFPELALSGYPPEDLILRNAFIDSILETANDIALETADGPALLVGAPLRDGKDRYNAVLLINDGSVKHVHLKHHLPNYGVFDEARIFNAGAYSEPLDINGTRLGVMICEDMWHPDVARAYYKHGADALVALNGSPFELSKQYNRQKITAERIGETALPVLYVNMWGGQDELVFDGGSFAMNPGGEIAFQAPYFQDDVSTLTLETANKDNRFHSASVPKSPPQEELIYRALCCGLEDYIGKNKFPGIILGLSGGIDSALSAAIAVDALGPDNVRAVLMPSPYTSEESIRDAERTASYLGIQLDKISIEEAMSCFGNTLAPFMADTKTDTTEENIQARIRGVLLMALSNKFGSMVLSTGNKSEMSVGYATLYGDMCGGFSVLKDVYKQTVFSLSDWRNQNKPSWVKGPDGKVMPQNVIDKPPTAELKPDQKDEDSLPPYDMLDAILKAFVEDRESISDIIASGFDKETVERIWRLLKNAEYKRRQAPPGVKITHCSFGRERRYPITNAYGGDR